MSGTTDERRALGLVPLDEYMQAQAIKAAAIPDAREARLLALAKQWADSALFHHRETDYSQHDLERGSQIGKESTYSRCARELLAALRGDA